MLQVKLTKGNCFSSFSILVLFHNFSLINRAEERKTRKESKFDSFSFSFRTVAIEIFIIFSILFASKLENFVCKCKGRAFVAKVFIRGRILFEKRKVNLMPIHHISNKQRSNKNSIQQSYDISVFSAHFQSTIFKLLSWTNA